MAFSIADGGVVLDLATADGTGNAPATKTGMIDSAIFSFLELGAGTGNLDPFVRIQRSMGTGGESGYNTDAGSPPLDTKAGAFTHSITVGDVPIVDVLGTQYFEFILDINESGNAGAFLTLDDLRIYESTSGSQTTTDLNALGDLKYRLDDGMDNTVEMFSYNSGSGASDYTIRVPVWANPDLNKFMTFYAELGATLDEGNGNSAMNWSASSGFEEFSFDASRATLNAVPEPSPILLLGLLGMAFSLKRRVGQLCNRN